MIKIDSKYSIGQLYPPFIIAEMSGNHNQSLPRALEIVECAAKAGVHAIKLQTYTADTMTLNIRKGEFKVSDPKSLWNGKSLYELYQEASTPWEWHQPIFNRCKELGIVGFSTPFDESAVDFLESLGVPCYKIASLEIVDLPLIRKIASTGKPLLISTGLATISEIDEAVECARNGGCRQLVLLKCTTAYPADPVDSNIRTICHMRDLFHCEVGLSDHTLGIGAAIAGIAYGAVAVEKHMTLNRSDGGVDSAFSMEPEEMASLVIESKRAWQSLGEISYGPTPDDKKSLQYRRSLYIVKKMSAGERLTPENMRAIRPGKGLPSKFYDILLGKKVNRDVSEGTPLTWEIVG